MKNTSQRRRVTQLHATLQPAAQLSVSPQMAARLNALMRHICCTTDRRKKNGMFTKRYMLLEWASVDLNSRSTKNLAPGRSCGGEDHGPSAHDARTQYITAQIRVHLGDLLLHVF